MLRRFTFVAIVNLLIFAGGLVAVEIGFRLSAGAESAIGPTLQWLEFAPWVMFRNPYVGGGSYQWSDAIHGKLITATILNNHLGFAMRDEIDVSHLRPKAENERVVIFTGGSAAWGVGATSNETNVAGRLQTILNETQQQYHYTVFNLAMGGWVSVQQFIALSLYGRNLQPDWLVGMDAVNDAAVTCAHSQGASHPMYYGLMEAYMKSYVFGQLHPVEYRGWLENELIKHSVAYRKLSGKSPVYFNALIDERDPGTGRSIIRETTWGDIENQLELYIQTEAEMVDLFPSAKIILSTQPVPFDFENMFGRVYRDRGTAEEVTAAAALKDKLDKMATAAKDRKCGLDLWPEARDWFMPSSALRLETLANQYRAAGRSVFYVNTGALFPTSENDRDAFFIDPVHLNDAGMDAIAHFYAREILATDLPNQFDPPQWASKPLQHAMSAPH